MFVFIVQKSSTSSGDVQYNLRMCVAVKRRLQVMLLLIHKVNAYLCDRGWLCYHYIVTYTDQLPVN